MAGHRIKYITPMLLRWTFLFILLACQTGELTLVGSLPIALKEASAAEVIPGTDILWTLEDKGNDSDIHAFDARTGKRIKSLKVNAPNKDWEDLTSDRKGHLYIGDFGNNHGKREEIQIYKLPNPIDLEGTVSVLATINAKVPKEAEKEDFEGFFLWDDYFYLFSKSPKEFVVLKVPNTPGKVTAEVLTHFEFKEEGDTKITSAAIRKDGKEVVLLNHDKVWVLTNFTDDNFFEGHLQSVPFGHDSQKEGICYWKDQLLITDERNKNEGGNIYALNCSQYHEK